MFSLFKRYIRFSIFEASLYVLNVLLGIIGLCQSIILVSVWQDASTVLSKESLNYFARYCMPCLLKMDAERATFNWHGRLHLENATFYLKKPVGAYLKCAALDLSIAPGQLLSGQMNPSLHIKKGEFYSPVMFSGKPSLTTPLLNEIYLDAEGGLYKPYLNYFHAHLGKISLNVDSGYLPKFFGKDTSKDYSMAAKSCTTILEKLAQLYYLGNYCTFASAHTCFLSFNNQWEAKVYLTFCNANLPQGVEISRGEAEFKFNQVVDNFHWQASGRCYAIKSSVFENKRSSFFLKGEGKATQVELSLHSCKLWGNKCAYLKAHGNIGKGFFRDGSFLAATKDMQLQGALQWTESQQLQLNVSGQTTLNAFKNIIKYCPEVDLLLRKLTLTRPIEWHSTLNLSFVPTQWQTFNLKTGLLGGAFSAQLYDFFFEKTPLSELSVRGNFNPSHLKLAKIYLDGPTHHVEGTAQASIPQKEYRLLLQGSINPVDLDNFLPLWWHELWQDFHFTESYPWTDIDLQNDWITGDTIRLWGFVRGEAFRYRGIPVDKLAMHYWAYAPHVTLRFNALCQNKPIESRLHWCYNPQRDGAYALFYEGTGYLPLRDGVQALADTRKTLLNPIRGNPLSYLKVKGIYYGPQSPNAEKDTFTLHLKVLETLYLWDLIVGNLSFDLEHRERSLFFENLKARIGGGLVNGKLDLTPSSSLKTDGLNETVAFEVDVQNIPSEKLWDGLPFLRNIKKLDTSAASHNENPYAGILNGAAKGKGTLGDLKSFDISGNMELTHGNLGKIHVLGPLSRLLDRTFLSFGSFKFSEAATSFQLKKGCLESPDLIIRGPMAQMQGNGYWDIDQSIIGMEIDIKLLSSIKLPIFKQIVGLLKPVSHGFHASLSGTLQNPQWTTSFNPFRFLESNKSVPPKKKTNLPPKRTQKSAKPAKLIAPQSDKIQKK